MSDNLQLKAKQEFQRLMDKYSDELIELATDWVYNRSSDLKGKRSRQESFKLFHDGWPAFRQALLDQDYANYFKVMDHVIEFRSGFNFHVSTLERGFLAPIKALELKIKKEVKSPELITEMDEQLDAVYETILFKLSDKYQEAVEKELKEKIKQLQTAEANLEKTVNARTKELQKRVLELESFHKLTVGRELKMIELKKELDELKKK